MHRKLAPATPLPPRLLYGVPCLAAAGAVACALGLRAGTVDALAAGTLAASVGLFGLPHGAADWWVMRRLGGGGRVMAAMVAGYVAAALLTLGFWRWKPAWALAGFLALTAWHFGSADASVLLAPGKRGAAWWMFAVGRGLLVICVPLTFHAAESAALLQPLAALAGGSENVVAGLLRVAPPLLWAGAVLQMLGVRLGPRDRRFFRNVLETGVLIALFRLAPPLWAFVCYWVAFHAWRHVWRVESLLHPGGTLADFHRRALPLTLVSLAGVGMVFALWPALANGSAGWRTAYFVLLSALTVPHAVVIGWLDAADWLSLERER